MAAKKTGGRVKTAPPAQLSFNNVVKMNPGSKGRQDMNNEEWGRFREKASQWFVTTKMAAFPETNQTQLMKSILDDTLYSRAMMKLREQHPCHNFFGALLILNTAERERDPLLYQQEVQAWDFLQKYIAESGKLDTSTEAASRASMRDVQTAAKDCCIRTGIQSAAD